MVKLSVDQALLKAKSHARKGEIKEAQKLYTGILKAFPKNKKAQQGLAALNRPEPHNATQGPPQETINQLINLYNQGQLGAVVERAKALTLQYPDAFVVWNVIGAAHKGLGKTVEASAAFKRVTELNPTYADGFSNLGVTLKDQGKLQEAIEAYNKALLLEPDYTEAHNNMGNALKMQGKLDEAIVSYNKALSLKPDYADAFNNMGNALQEQGKLDKAINSYEKAVSLKPDNAEAYYNMGVVLQAQAKLDQAITSYEKALSLKPDYFVAYNNMGNALKKQGKLEEAITSYEKALSLKPDYSDVYNNMGNAFKEQGKLDEAINSYEKAVSFKPDNAEAYYNMGVVLQDQGKLDQAITSYEKALSLKPNNAEAYNNMGVVLQEQGKLDQAITSYEKALSLKPDYKVVQSQKMHQQANICDWSSIEADRSQIKDLGINSAVSPFSMLSLEDAPERHRIRSENIVKEMFFSTRYVGFFRHSDSRKHLKVGYFSADFNNHATMHLMAQIFEQHDKQQFEIYAYSYGPDKKDEMRKCLIERVDVFHDVREMTDLQIVELAKSEKLDIAIDLKGFTTYSRLAPFAYGLAPIQISYLGYPGTLGADFIDYIVADPVVIPANKRQYYSEHVIYLPNTYQPTDNTRVISDKTITREDMQLPSNGFVFCCFNNNYKISPKEFDIWMRLLGKVESSVLWLLKSNKWAERNLKREAEARGINAERLIFAEKLPQAEHLARQKLADLFLDTFNVNAHTTTSDALWAGLPVLTKLGEGFAARVAGSLLHAVGLPELVTETEAQYEALALKLATNPERLAQIKAKLAENRITQPLFDSEQYTRHLEAGYKMAYERYLTGSSPEHIFVKDK